MPLHEIEARVDLEVGRKTAELQQFVASSL
jgi:hypothetical protein